MAMTSNLNKATWIWYPGDFEVWLGNRFNNRRTERGALFPPFWKQDSHWVTVEFSNAFSLEKDETITISCEGQFNLMLDGKLQSMIGRNTFTVPAGEHKLNLKVWNQATPPALFIEGETVFTDSSWLATYEDKIWIDENGVAHGSGIYMHAASWNFNRIDTPPSCYSLERIAQDPVLSEEKGRGILYDFGKETFGYLKVHGLKGTVHIYYGESAEEALDKEHCETLDVLSDGEPELGSKAFRFVYIEKTDDSSYERVSMDYEYAPFDTSHSGRFECSDDLLNRIWKVGAYTMDLTTREFFMDGIKRDRWTWSGDAIQSYLMNYYLRFDTACVKRTIRQLRGKDPVTSHVNTIMDYTFYWIISVYDYYLYTGDVEFVREIYPRMQSLMEYVGKRTNSDGMAEGQPDDWIFVDWVDFPMHKRGALAFEQILLCKAYFAMANCAEVLYKHPLENPPQGSIDADDHGLNYAVDHDIYYTLAHHLKDRIDTCFWDEETQAYLHAIEDGELNRQVTRFPNMFAIIYDLVDDDRKKEIMHHVMLNASIERITTPYMRFYELEALCQMGFQTQVLDEVRNYWGGMIREGATTFWEKYVPEEKGREHLAMYGRPYGKSLCHAWGASPVYLFGKYYLGVKPLKAGYKEYEVRPVLGGLQWLRGAVPTPFGLIHVFMDQQTLTVRIEGDKNSGCKGVLVAPDGQHYDLPAAGECSINYSIPN